MTNTAHSQSEIAPQTQVLKEALALFHATDRGLVLRCRLFNLGLSFKLTGLGIPGDVNDIVQDIWNMTSLLLRLRWTREQAKNGFLHPEIWRSFSQLDIENFLVQARSSMDSAAHLIQETLPKGKQLPNSFRKLRDGISKHQKKLPPDLALLISQAQWFDLLRKSRDTLVHDGGMVLVFGMPQDELCAQIYGKSPEGILRHPALMHNANVLYFDRYACLLMANLLVFFDQFAAAIASARSVQLLGGAESRSPGFDHIQQQIRDLAQRLMP